jgi:hypothetical protein
MTTENFRMKTQFDYHRNSTFDIILFLFCSNFVKGEVLFTPKHSAVKKCKGSGKLHTFITLVLDGGQFHIPAREVAHIRLNRPPHKIWKWE